MLNVEYCFADRCKYRGYNGFCKFLYKDYNFKYPLDAICVKELVVNSSTSPEGLMPLELYKELRLKRDYGFK
jgi:hypothetical protein